MYFIYKQGVYGHGVFWIGEDLEAGKAEADRLASADEDDYHDWELQKLGASHDPSKDGVNEIVYTGVRR
jgi:hypothetical protein